MINNDALFDHFRTARRRGYRSGWTAPNRTVARVVSHYVPTVTLPEPVEIITETDVFDAEREYWSGTTECPYCGDRLDRTDTVDGDTCYPCDRANREDWQETLRAITREEHALR